MPAFIRHPVAPEALGADLTGDSASRSPNHPASHEISSQRQGHGRHLGVGGGLRQQHALKVSADLGAGKHITCSLM